MTTPKLYRAETLDGEPGQRLFHVHATSDTWDNIALAEYPSVTEKVEMLTIPVQETLICTQQAGMRERFDLLNLDISLHTGYASHESKMPLTTVELRLHYALDPELEQLVDFLQYNRKLRHEGQMAGMHNKLLDHVQHISHLKSELAEFDRLLGESCDRETMLRRPWYVKVWHYITGA